jgi:hypothetical protein
VSLLRGRKASGKLKRPVIVAMVAMLTMEPALDQIIHVVAVRNRFMSAIRPMGMSVASGVFPVRATIGIPVAYCDHMLVDMPFVRVMEVTVVQIVGMSVVEDGNMAAIRAMPVGMIAMCLML